MDGMPWRSAASFAGGGGILRPRPCGAVGRASAASSMSRRDGEAVEDPRAERRRRRDRELQPRSHHTSGPSIGCGRSCASAPRRSSGRRPVEDQDAVEVVELMLDDPGLQPLCLDRHGSPFGSRRLDA